MQEGQVRPGNVLKVDCFLNHQLDVDLLDKVGEEFYRIFKDDGINKILTIEASGIAIACMTARHFNVPVVFAKKAKSKNIDGEVYTSTVHSYTYGRDYDITLSKKFLSPSDDVAAKPEFAAFGKDIAMQVAAANPSYLNESDVPEDVLAKEKEIVLAQMANDPKTANKPDAIKEKMAIGKLGKFYKEACLVDQAFIKDGGMDVKKYVADTAKALGGDIKIAAFTHFTKGEGLEKRNEDFAAEVAAAIKG